MMTQFVSMSLLLEKYLSSFQQAYTLLSWIPRLQNKMLISRKTFLLPWDCFLFCNTEIIENIWIISFLFISNQYTIEQLPDLISRYMSVAHIRHLTSRGKDMEYHLHINIFINLPPGSLRFILSAWDFAWTMEVVVNPPFKRVWLKVIMIIEKLPTTHKCQLWYDIRDGINKWSNKLKIVKNKKKFKGSSLSGSQKKV